MRGHIKATLVGVVLGVSACLLSAAAVVVYPFVSLPVEDGRGHDGSSLETAVVVLDDYDEDAISTEYQWITWHCPTCTLVSQSLIHENGRTYDAIDLVRSNGEPYTVYFDITASFGHW